MFTVKSEPADPLDIVGREDVLPFKFNIKIEIEEDTGLDLLIQDTRRVAEAKFEPFVLGAEAEGGADEVDRSGTFEELIKLGEYPCAFCPELFMNRYNALIHQLEHLRVPLAPPPMYLCSICEAIFTQKRPLAKHIKASHKEKTIKPRLKKKLLSTRKTCKFCNKRFKYRHWYEHVKSVHNHGVKDVVWKCSLCYKKFKCERYLVRHHLYVHEDNKPEWMKRKERSKFVPEKLQCPECAKVFKSQDCLGQHVKNVHTDVGKRFECGICASVLKSHSYLRTHMRRVHYDDGKSYACDICKKSFKSPRYLKLHQKRTHEKGVSVKREILLEEY